MRAFLLTFFVAVVAASAVPAAHNGISRDDDPNCLVSGVNMAYTPATKSLLVNWVMPTACPDAESYTVEFSINGVVDDVPQIGPGFPMAQKILDNDPTCETITAAVKTLGAEEAILAKSEPEQLEIVLPAVEDLKFSQDEAGIHVVWSQLVLGEACTVKYKVFVDEVEEDVEYDAPEYLISPDKLQMCKVVKVEVQATSNNFLSEKTAVDVDGKMPAVSGLEVKHTSDGVEVDFDPLTADKIAEACGSITYKVVEREEACFKSSYGVLAVSEGELLGLEATQTIERKPTTVNNLRADVRGQEIVIQWAPPFGGEKCNLEYSGKYGTHELDKPIHATTLTIPYATAACALDKLEVWAITNNLPGEISSLDIVGELGAVSDLKCTAGSATDGNTPVKCVWNQPEGCTDAETTMSYEVMFYDGTEVKTKSTDLKEFEFETSACDDTWVIVTPLLNDSVSGDIIEVKVNDCPARK